VAILREPCWHSCPWCKKDWVHSVLSSALPDEYFLPCRDCQLRHDFDAVGHAMKQAKRPARRATTEEVEEFSVQTPEREEEA
jgi:hypothetical protein